MSYQVLARKWRPKQFAELVGQGHVKTALSNALTSSRLHHAYLFTGTRGVGKTTIARIFAKSLNCETGITATPCGVCSACKEIDAGNFVDLLEIDAASRTKVEDTRDLLDNVQYAPSRGRFKVYLIDEVHMLSRHSFNALLKTLEEPPPHVKFLLATTDPQKLPVTVLSRCLQFSLKALSPDQIAGHLAHVLTAENIQFDTAALPLLAKAANGSLRDSLSLTDQAIAQSNSQISLEAVRDMLGFLDQQFASAILGAILNQDYPAMQTELQALISQHSDYSRVLDDMLSLLHQAAMTQLAPAAAQLSEQPDFVAALAKNQSPEALQLYYQLLISGKRELSFAPDERTGLEMALLRALAFVPIPASNMTAATVSPVLPQRHAQPATIQPSPVTAQTATEPPATAPLLAETIPASQQPDRLLSPGSSIDPLTASIIKRRGLAVDAAVEAKPPKKSEHRPVPVPAAAAILLTRSESEAVMAKNIAYVDEPEDEYEPLLADDPNHAAMLNTLWQQSEQPAETASIFNGEINQQNFSIRYAAEVDSWAALIETLPVGGLMRLFLLNSAMQLEQQQIKLEVQQSQQHLDNPEFRHELQGLLSQGFGRQLQLQLNYSNQIPQSPLAIQQRIEQERISYVTRLMQNDPNVQQLQQQFDASLLPDTLQVN
ncbi:DNA polymerase III subunit gamma/tau [Arsukibacterium sp. MJ3]|uniref:DNA polymerase III subunit gamma/tau n=1 Tax=Arsukibacterium sp. MJ3 TaxID=1632859 RepID=UPI0006271FE0|nr:DNA polymerase III subunit gamma/tau [Arsukibacterium sp. MJ3]KKO50082.1 DNA polymerase III subunit gamma/tau [Arsukibacterium sp. MJ3]